MMHPILRVALVQCDIAWEDPDENFRRLSPKLLSAPPCDVLVLPEAFSTGFTMAGEALDSALGNRSLGFLREHARQLDCALCASTFYRPGPTERVVNRMFFVEPSGKTHHYDKRHRFAMAGEHDAYGPGHARPVVIEYLGWRILLQVCYDLRFPVFSRNRAGASGYDLAVYVANWPTPRREHWRTLLQARAIENQCYVVGVNRVGDDAVGNSYAGDSLVIMPSGTIEYDAANRNELGSSSLDAAALVELRRALPFLDDADEYILA